MNYNEKIQEIGHRVRVLIDMHLENPEKYHSEFVVEHLVKVYERLEFDPIEEYVE